MTAKINFDVLQRAYFQWDIPVEYHIDDNTILPIYPILLKDSELFLASCEIILIDKDKIPDARIISMSYLEFLLDSILKEQIMIDKFCLLIKLCLHWDNFIMDIDGNGKPILQNADGTIKINSKKFNDIRRIILYQNIIGYDDEYINPELKQAMDETDALKNRNIEFPNMERQMAIITAHTGITKFEQMKMTLRSHNMLFREVCGEANFQASWGAILSAGEVNKHEHWIYKRSKNKFDGYITERNSFASKIGANPDNIAQNSNVNSLENMYNNFEK